MAESGRAPQLVLGSASPRRRAMLDRAGFPHRAMSVDLDEDAIGGVTVAERVEAIARAKYAALRPEADPTLPLLTADTLVVHDDSPLGKPVDAADARRMVRQMAGTTIAVITAVCFGQTPEPRLDTMTTLVAIRPLSDLEIDDYVATGEALDKAGGLALQSAGSGFVAGIDGCWSNVVGLPLCVVCELLDTSDTAGAARCSGPRCGVGLIC